MNSLFIKKYVSLKQTTSNIKCLVSQNLDPKLNLKSLVILIDALLDEDAFQRGKMQALEEFAAADEEFAAQEFACVPGDLSVHFRRTDPWHKGKAVSHRIL